MAPREALEDLFTPAHMKMEQREHYTSDPD